MTKPGHISMLDLIGGDRKAVYDLSTLARRA